MSVFRVHQLIYRGVLNMKIAVSLGLYIEYASFFQCYHQIKICNISTCEQFLDPTLLNLDLTSTLLGVLGRYPATLTQKNAHLSNYYRLQSDDWHTYALCVIVLKFQRHESFNSTFLKEYFFPFTERKETAEKTMTSWKSYEFLKKHRHFEELAVSLESHRYSCRQLAARIVVQL